MEETPGNTGLAAKQSDERVPDSRRSISLDFDQYPVEVLEAVLGILKAQHNKRLAASGNAATDA